MTDKYRAEPAHAYVLRVLEDLTLIFHRPSGLTHIVVEPVPQILAVMADDALTVDEVLGRLAADFDLSDDASARDAIVARLGELAALGLVRPIFGVA